MLHHFYLIHLISGNVQLFLKLKKEAPHNSHTLPQPYRSMPSGDGFIPRLDHTRDKKGNAEDKTAGCHILSNEIVNDIYSTKVGPNFDLKKEHEIAKSINEVSYEVPNTSSPTILIIYSLFRTTTSEQRRPMEPRAICLTKQKKGHPMMVFHFTSHTAIFHPLCLFISSKPYL